MNIFKNIFVKSIRLDSIPVVVNRRNEMRSTFNYTFDSTDGCAYFDVFRTTSDSYGDTLQFSFDLPPCNFVTGTILSVEINGVIPAANKNRFKFEKDAVEGSITRFQIAYTLIDLPIDEIFVRLICSDLNFEEKEIFSNFEPRDNDSRDHLQKRLIDDFSSLLTSGDDADVTISVDGRELKAHRLILKTRSPYFAKMLTSGMTEDTTGRVEMIGIGAEAFEFILKYLYTGTVDEGIEDHAVEILPKVEEMGMTEMKGICVEAMRRIMSTENVCDFLRAAHLHDCGELKKRCKEFIKQNAGKVTESEGWKDVTHVPELMSELFCFMI